MGCCESSNRRKVDDLNPVLGATIQDQLVPLMSEAAFKGDVQTMQKLVAKGANVNQHDQKADVNAAGMVNGFTPLFAACENNDLDVAKLLVEAGADINAVSRDGRTPLQHALHHNRTYVADYLNQVARQRLSGAAPAPATPVKGGPLPALRLPTNGVNGRAGGGVPTSAV